MRKRHLTLFAVFALALIAYGVETETMKDLRIQRNELALKIHEKRVELIKSDPALLTLQNKIMELHRELAIRLNNNPEMLKLMEELSDLDSRIRDIEETPEN
jgi:hypothetical protein